MNRNKQTYDKYALKYHEKRMCEEENLWNLYLDRPMIEKFLGEPLPDTQVLDYGCGSGLLTRWLKDKMLDVRGVDFSRNLINIAKQENPDITFNLSDIISTPYATGTFDIIISGLVLHYVQDLDTVFTEVARILNTNGILIFTMHHPFDEVMEVSVADNEYQAIGTSYFHNHQYTWEMLNGMKLVSYHHTFETIAESLFKNGFVIERIAESQAEENLREAYPDFYARTNAFPSFCGFRARKV